MKRNKLISLLIMFIVSGLYVNAQNSDPAKEDPMRTDWANLARFQEDNQKIGLPATGENRVVFMGNSITEGWIMLCLIFLRQTLCKQGHQRSDDTPDADPFSS